MNRNITEIQDVFLGKINNISNKFGFNNIMIQLYSLLYLNNRALSLNDMVERLKISKATVSITMRALERYGAVRRVWVKGSRKDYYEAETDIAKVAMDRINSMVERRLSEIDDMLKSSYMILDSVHHQDGEGAEDVHVFKEQLDKLKSLYSQIKTLFDLFNSGLLNNLMNNKLSNNEGSALLEKADDRLKTKVTN